VLISLDIRCFLKYKKDNEQKSEERSENDDGGGKKRKVTGTFRKRKR
jgi:hypothetical protein